jgi:L-lactate dehydrogenase complex protein LldG
MTARAEILAKLRQHGRSTAETESWRDEYAERVDVAPAEHFAALAAAEAATVRKLPNLAAVPEAVASYLQEQGKAPHVVLDQSSDLQSSDINEAQLTAAGLTVATPPVRPDGDVLLSGCYGAVAETGTLVISSGPAHSLGDDFLAETHIVVLHEQRIYRELPDLWDAMRATAADGGLPREFCLVTGPSRTADLGVPAKLGAHGPARVHILLVAAAA